MSRRPRPGPARVAPAVLTAAGAALAGGLVTEFGLIGFAGVLGLLLAVLGTRLAPKKLAIVGLVLVLLSRSIEIGSGVGITAYTDEIVTGYLGIVLVGRRLLEGKPFRWPPGIPMFACFVVAGVFSSVAASVPLSIAAAGGVLIVKGLLLYLFLAQIDWTKEDIPWLARTGVWILGVALLCSVINLIVPKSWTAVLSVTGHSQYRWILPSVIGPFTHPLQYGNFMSLAGIACAVPLLYWAEARGRAKGAPVLFLLSVLGVLLSFRRTAFVGLTAAVAYLALRRRNAGLLVTAALAVPIAGVALYPLIHQIVSATYDSFVVQGESNARTQMTLDSITLAFQHFPFGVGFGRFGSATAAAHYSPEYVRLGYDAIHGLGSPTNRHNTGHFLTDTMWPAIVGETGLIGTLFFLLGLWRMFALFGRAARAVDVPLRLLGLVGMGWMVHILFESVAYQVFVTSPTSPALWGLGGVVAAIVSSTSVTADASALPASPEELRDSLAPDRPLVRAGGAGPRGSAHASSRVPVRRRFRGSALQTRREPPRSL